MTGSKSLTGPSTWRKGFRQPREQNIGRRVAIRCEPENAASNRVAEKCGFHFVRQIESTTDTHADGAPVIFNLYLLLT